MVRIFMDQTLERAWMTSSKIYLTFIIHLFQATCHAFFLSHMFFSFFIGCHTPQVYLLTHIGGPEPKSRREKSTQMGVALPTVFEPYLKIWVSNLRNVKKYPDAKNLLRWEWHCQQYLKPSQKFLCYKNKMYEIGLKANISSYKNYNVTYFLCQMSGNSSLVFWDKIRLIHLLTICKVEIF